MLSNEEQEMVCRSWRSGLGRYKKAGVRSNVCHCRGLVYGVLLGKMGHQSVRTESVSQLSGRGLRRSPRVWGTRLMSQDVEFPAGPLKASAPFSP